MPFKFFNIGKANAEIEKLEARVAELTAENTSLRENAPEIEAAAEALRGDLQKAVARAEKAEGEVAAAGARISELTAAKEKAEAEAKAAAEKLANPAEIIKTTAAAQAAAIVASVGHPGVATNPGETAKVDNELEAARKLTGLEKFVAIERIEAKARAVKQ